MVTSTVHECFITQVAMKSLTVGILLTIFPFCSVPHEFMDLLHYSLHSCASKLASYPDLPLMEEKGKTSWIAVFLTCILKMPTWLNMEDGYKATYYSVVKWKCSWCWLELKSAETDSARYYKKWDSVKFEPWTFLWQDGGVWGLGSVPA